MTAIRSSSFLEAAPAESASAVRNRHAHEAANDAPPDAFAARLAAMLSPRPAPLAIAKKVGASSDLDGGPRAGVDGAPNTGYGLAEGTVTPGTTTAKGASANSAAEAAAEARAGADAAPVTNVNSDADALNPDFRARLGRVVTRMREEYGSDVEIVEGFRPQARQEFLYAQGRTKPGEVVTWTKSSKHTLGLAADVKIDGSYDNTVSYQHLAQIAAQEGLRTLGARDPGHVELPSRGGAAAWGAGAIAADATRVNESVSRAVGLAMAQDGASAADATGSDNDGHAFNGFLSRMSHAGTGTPMSAQHQAGGGAESSPGGSGNQQHRSSDSDKPLVGAVAEPARVASVADVASIAQVAHAADIGSPTPPSTSSTRVDGAQIVAPSNAAERVGHMLDVRDATPALPLSHVTLDLDNANGGTDRITVQLRGGAVDTAISLGDSGRADKMSLRVGELQHALEHHGLEAGSIHVGSTAGDVGAGWTPRRGSDQDAHTGQPSPNNRDNRQDADEARQRSRREQHGGKQK